MQQVHIYSQVVTLLVPQCLFRQMIVVLDLYPEWH